MDLIPSLTLNYQECLVQLHNAMLWVVTGRRKSLIGSPSPFNQDCHSLITAKGCLKVLCFEVEVSNHVHLFRTKRKKSLFTYPKNYVCAHVNTQKHGEQNGIGAVK